MMDYTRVGPSGDPVLDFSNLTHEQAAALTEVTVDDYVDGRGENAREVRKVKFKLGDKRAALMDIAKLFGWVVEKRENKIVDEFDGMSLERRGLRPQFQRKKPRGKKIPAHIVRGNATRARVRSRVEHVFAAQKCRFGLIVRTVGMVRARAKIGMANLVYNFARLAWLQERTAPA